MALEQNPPPETFSVRSRGVRFLSALFWICSALFILISANALLSVTEHWLTLLQKVRTIVNFPAPTSGPDWFLLCGLIVAALVPACAIVWVRRRYVHAWRRRLSQVWTEPAHLRQYAKIRPMKPNAGEAELVSRSAYISALLASPPWKDKNPELQFIAGDAVIYRRAAATLLMSIESDVRNRAVATGLAVGVSRNAWLDLLTIAAAAFEMQLHVLSRLGKRPSLRTWAELWKRTAASLFLNTYLNREESWALKLALQKVALGLEAAGDVSADAIQSLQNLDWDTYLDDMIPNTTVFALAKAALSSFGFVAGVGATGLKQIGSLIERNGEELLEGILAGGVLYYHGIAIASECLSLDLEHRYSAEMNRTPSQAITNVCAAAGQMLRKQVKDLRTVLKQSRKQAVPSVAKLAAQGAQTSGKLWNKMRGSVKPPDVFSEPPADSKTSPPA